MSYSWETHSAASAPASTMPLSTSAGVAWRERMGERIRALRGPRPELVTLLVLAGVLNLWALSRNGWANDYYSAAVRSMSSSWHDFLFASLDRSGVMTVDKPPLALWVQALSVRVFGYHSLSILVPQALMGMASVALVYDLVRRRFGRIGGLIGGLALALTPIAVAVSRHNNPDALLVLCSVGALWCAVRGLQDGRTRWLVLAGVCVGLGFETKMGVALTVVPGIAAAWMWVAPAARNHKGTGGRLRALRQLLYGGAAMAVVAGAWPALVELTPASDRPWVSGTSDNRVLSLIFGYNGLGRVDGQTGGPGGVGGGGSMFGGSSGPLRLLNESLGGQVGWLLGFAVLGGLAILAVCRLRRSHPSTGWLIAVGGAFLTTAALFSFASGIFHPYYVSLLAPFAAALVGAGASQLMGAGRLARLFGPLAILAGILTELVVRSRYPGQLSWLTPLLIVVGAAAVVALVALDSRRTRMAAIGAVVAALLLAPGVWAFDTLGHATNGTFPEGGPASVLAGGGGPGGRLGARFGPGGALRMGAQGGPPALFGSPARSESSGAPEAAGAPTQPGVGLPGFPRSGGFAGGGPMGGPMGATVSSKIVAYVKQHGGGTIALASQSSAATSIIATGANVAGIGGFSGRESEVSVTWLANEVRAGKIRWVLDEQGTSGGAGAGFVGRLPGDTRAGSESAIKAAARSCVRVTIPTGSSSAAASGLEGASSASGATSTALYDCRGRASALVGTQQSSS